MPDQAGNPHMEGLQDKFTALNFTVIFFLNHYYYTTTTLFLTFSNEASPFIFIFPSEALPPAKSPVFCL